MGDNSRAYGTEVDSLLIAAKLCNSHLYPVLMYMTSGNRVLFLHCVQTCQM